MELPPLSKRAVRHGALFLFLLLLVLVDIPLFRAPEKKEVVIDRQIDMTKDILENPFLADRELWQVEEHPLYIGGESVETSESSVNMQALEFLMENSFVSERGSEKSQSGDVSLAQLTIPKPSSRSSATLFDIKSTEETKLFRRANTKIITHTVKAGETLLDISRRYKIDMQTLIGANRQISNLGQLKAGQELNILNTKGVIHKLAPYETLADVARIYHVSYNTVVNYNGLRSGRIKAGMNIIVPGANPLPLGQTTSSANTPSTSGYIWPIAGKVKISSNFGARWGRMHEGIDISVPIGTPVKAAKSGKVILSGWSSGYGYAVYIKHDNDTVTRYGHNNKLLVKKDAFVYQGQTIALSGNSGRSTGPHLHFEIRIKNKAVNPRKYLK
jgi:murein DD-endopeptidase MepM/ murein hydrolase activator NlpD